MNVLSCLSLSFFLFSSLLLHFLYLSVTVSLIHSLSPFQSLSLPSSPFPPVYFVSLCTSLFSAFSRVSQLRLKFFALCALLILPAALLLPFPPLLKLSLSFLTCNLLQLCKCRTREHFVFCFVRLRGVAACPPPPSLLPATPFLYVVTPSAYRNR